MVNDPWTRLIDQFDWPLVTGVLVVLLIVTLVIYAFQKMRENEREAANTPGGLLSTFRKLYEDGELSATEYQRIKERLRQGLTGTVATTNTTAPTTTSDASDNRVDHDEPPADS